LKKIDLFLGANYFVFKFKPSFGIILNLKKLNDGRNPELANATSDILVQGLNIRDCEGK